MKYSRLLLAGSMLLVASMSPSYAQSQITLYGVLDEGMDFQSNVAGGKRFSLDSLSGVYGSRWGLNGTEDLGGGNQAIFVLESGVNLNNGAFGQGGTPFGRQLYLGMKNAHIGALTLGRQYDMVFYFPEVLAASSLAGAPSGTHPGDFDNAANTLRVNNAVRYMSPNFGGFEFGGEYSVSGVPGNVTANSGYSIGGSYKSDTVKVALAYEYFKTPAATPAGAAFFTGQANGASPLSQALNRGYANAQSFELFMIAANYLIGNLTLGASVSTVQYGEVGQRYAGASPRLNNADIGFSYKFTPAFQMGFSYDYLFSRGLTDASGAEVGNQHFHQLAISGDYSLSKRTDVYAVAGWQRASGISSLGSKAVADIDNLGDASSNHQVLVRVAIRHKF